MAKVKGIPDSIMDAYIAAYENPATEADTSDLGIMRMQHERWVEVGVLDPDQPTPWSHHQHQRRLLGDFTPEERTTIRTRLGLI